MQFPAGAFTHDTSGPKGWIQTTMSGGLSRQITPYLNHSNGLRTQPELVTIFPEIFLITQVKLDTENWFYNGSTRMCTTDLGK